MHWLLVPRVESAAGMVKLNSTALFDRERLRAMQTSNGVASAPLGSRCVEPDSLAEHLAVPQRAGRSQFQWA